MAKNTTNERCPFREECERKCVHQGQELDCNYYSANAMPGYEIFDQEQRREEAYRRNEEQSCCEEPKAKEETAPSGQTSGQGNTYLTGKYGVTEKIKQAMYDAAKQFVYIGFLLWEVQEYGYYEEGGYQNVYEYAEAELHFKRSSTKNFIAVCKAFSNSETRYEANGSVSIVGQKISTQLQPRYEQFNYSQLCEMLSMAPAKQETITPDMTIKQIREIKRSPEFELEPNVETIPLPLPDDGATTKNLGQTSGQEETPDTATITLNNIWKNDAPKELIRQLVKLAGLRCTPSMCFDITIKKHEDS